MELLEQCQLWCEQGDYQTIVNTLEAIPAGQRTPEMDSELGRAYNGLAGEGQRELYQKALERLRPHDPEMDSELGRAYNGLAGEGQRELYQKALERLRPHEEYFEKDHCWNYRIASAYYYLDEEGPALYYFKKALEARPGDEDTQEYIDDCMDRLTLPRFEKTFRQRTRQAWAVFEGIEAELRAMIEADTLREKGGEILAKCRRPLEIALKDVAFELGFNGEKYELILSPEGNRSRLFPLVYFQQHAPASVLEHWNIWVGRQHGEKYELILSPEGNRSRLFPLVYFQQHAPASVLEHWNIWVGRQPADADFTLDCGGQQVSARDVQVWLEPIHNGQVRLTLFCEKLLPLMETDSDQVWWMLSALTDQTLGEVAAIALIGGMEVYTAPKDEPPVLLAELPQALRRMGLRLWSDAVEYLDASYLSYELEPVEDPSADWRLDVVGYLSYELEPVEDPSADWRLDVVAGTTCLPALINDYLSARSATVDDYHRNGIAAGFFLYPIQGFGGENATEKALDFRDALEDAVYEQAGEDAVTFLGGATGLYCGYLDFIGWDLHTVLQAGQDFLEQSGIPWAQFHSFRRDVGGVTLVNREEEKEPEICPETGSLLSAENIETLESFVEDNTGYYGKMLHWLQEFVETGVEEGRFTEKQARRDLQIALWYAYACTNLDEYLYYYRAAQWMKDSERNAEEGRFTEKQARRDLQIALWYAYACTNLDEYLYYYRAAQWMKDSERNAAGCGTWYYRYSVTLMHCNRLEEALEYAERGAREEPDYPWIWLQVGKLRAHFGDPAGALQAVKQGLALVPGDYEFLTLEQEILVPGDYEFLTLEQEIYAGATLEQMLCHWINPEADSLLQAGNDADAEEKQNAIACVTVNEAGLAAFYRMFRPEQHWINPEADSLLQAGNDADAEEKQNAIACVTVNEAGLAAFYRMFRPEQYGYTRNDPDCQFPYPVGERQVVVSFRMNEAGLSKLSADWLQWFKVHQKRSRLPVPLSRRGAAGGGFLPDERGRPVQAERGLAAMVQGSAGQRRLADPNPGGGAAGSAGSGVCGSELPHGLCVPPGGGEWLFPDLPGSGRQRMQRSPVCRVLISRSSGIGTAANAAKPGLQGTGRSRRIERTIQGDAPKRGGRNEKDPDENLNRSSKNGQ